MGVAQALFGPKRYHSESLMGRDHQHNMTTLSSSSRAILNDNLMAENIGIPSSTPSAIPTSLIYTPKRNGEHTRPFHVGAPSPPAILGNLSKHDGNAKENVTLKMTSKYFKLLRDTFNSFNLSNAAEQSGSWLCKDRVTVQVEKKIHCRVLTFYIKL